KQVAALTSAASKARDVAQQNLEAVEEKVRLLDQMIVDIQPAAGAPAGETAATPAARATSRFPVPPARPEAGRSELSPVRAANAIESGSLAAVKEEVWQPVARSPGLGGTTVQLPLEKRVQAQSLLADLKAEKRPDGVVFNVPGEELFALDSESIESTAHDTLAKVAELIDLFDGREVKIIGHTDAMGDAAYNQALSERRARLVRDFFVHNYDVAGSRFTIAGAGERQPIATNTTRAGRRANRRIEVVIED
ncbi:MAG TPA: OmpA family protein, partial [Geminicoccaceae bacterium]